MKVFEIMTIDVGFCCLYDDLSKAARIMWERDCGIVPVVDHEMRVVGVVTDRDIAIAAASRNQRPSEILASEMLSKRVECCAMEDLLSDVLSRMASLRVRRLPVTGGNGELLGIISIADVLRQGNKKTIRRAAKTFVKISLPSGQAGGCRD